MEIIWKTQNPPDCRKAKFYVVEGFMQGFGSEFHVYGVALAIAVDHGRVLLVKGGWKWRYKNDFCRSQQKSNLECYFLPWSKCTLEDAYHSHYADDAAKIDLLVRPPQNDGSTPDWSHQLDSTLWFTVLKHGSKGNWNQVAADIPGKTPVQCYLRWKMHVRQRGLTGRQTVSTLSSAISLSICLKQTFFLLSCLHNRSIRL
jgi:hypothetical protein